MPQAQAAPGDVIVSDPGANTLFVQSNCASPPCAAPTTLFSGSPYVTPEGVAVDASGNIIVADGSGKVFRQSPSGGTPTLISSTGYTSPAGVAIRSSGDIIVADLGAKTIFRQSPSGGAPALIFSGSPYITPQGVAIDLSGNIIVTDYGVRAIFLQNNCATPPCAPPTVISSTGYVTPEGVTIDSLGNFIVADQGGSTAILRQSPSGPPATLFSGTPYITPEFDVVLKPSNTGTGKGCDLTMTKTITPNQVQPGGTAIVTLTLTPTSSADCNGNVPVFIAIDDGLPAGLVVNSQVSIVSSNNLICDVSSSGDAVNCEVPFGGSYPSLPATVTFSVQATAPAGSTVNNCALGTIQDTQNQWINQHTGCATLTVVGGGSGRGCDFAITKTMNVSADGLTVTINLTVTNQGAGNCNVENPLSFTVNDMMPSGLTATSAGGAHDGHSDADWTCDLTVSCHPPSGGSISPGGSSTITITAKVTGGTGKIENCAHVIFEPDTNQNNNVSCASATVGPSGACDLAITKTISANSLQIGGTANITITVTSVGNQPCKPITSINDDLQPADLVAMNVPMGPFSPGAGWTCNYFNSGHQFTCTSQNSLPPSYSIAITFQVRAEGPEGSYTNCATISNVDDHNPTNDKSCVTFEVNRGTPSGCDLKITKTISPSSGASGTLATVNLVIVNVGSTTCGPITAWPTVMTDNMSQGMVQAPGTQAGCGITSSAWNCEYPGLQWFCQPSNSGSTLTCYPTGPTPGYTFSTIPINYPLNIHFVVRVTGSPGSIRLNCATVSDPNDINHANDQSCVTFTIPGGTTGRCIIATAAYGSEMAAPVQFLRSFRDNQVQKTATGSTFLTAFNGWYYSWAPGVAQRIAPNENYKAVTRVIIAPLIGSLFVGNAVFSVLAPLNPELAVVSTGLLASALIGLIYLTPAYALTWKLSKRRITKRTICSLAIIAGVLAFIATLTTGTFSASANLTALTVVETMLLTPAFALRKMVSYVGGR